MKLGKVREFKDQILYGKKFVYFDTVDRNGPMHVSYFGGKTKIESVLLLNDFNGDDKDVAIVTIRSRRDGEYLKKIAKKIQKEATTSGSALIKKRFLEALIDWPTEKLDNI